MRNESKTPRTDAEHYGLMRSMSACHAYDPMVEFARTLERELAEARKESEWIKLLTAIGCRVSIDCPKGLWGVCSENMRWAITEANHYAFLYANDGEYEQDIDAAMEGRE